ncbi:MAG: DM13 domain-containing protein [Spirulina sp. SIO3F2]|nr:DM13 domain-containing protein [Spirulina sp. SIO3F2]
MRILKSLLTAAAVATALSVLPQSSVRADGHDAEPVVIAEASFVGESNHTVSGDVQIVQVGEGDSAKLYVVLGENFSFDGAPDPRLGFSSDDEFIPATIFSSLNLDSGKQIYRLPANLTLAELGELEADELTIWCEKFGVPLAEAKF